jgi:hypothetical protein
MDEERRGAAIVGVREAEFLDRQDGLVEYTDVTATIDAGIASLREHRAYLEGLGGDSDPDEFPRNMAGYAGLGAGVEYAVAFRHYPMG